MKWFKTRNIYLEYKLLLENTQEIIIFFDSAGKIMDCSTKTKQELGYGEDIVRTSITHIFKDVFTYEESSIKIQAKFQNTLKETVAYRKNQTCFPVNLKVAVIKKSNKFIGICTAFNIKDKKQAAREISFLKKELNSNDIISSEMVAKVAHELRTPLNGIMGFAHNLLDMDLKMNQLEAVNIINKCCVNMNSLINDLMDYAVISNKKLQMIPKEFAFYDFIQHIVGLNMGYINNKGLKLLLYISDEIPDRLIGDELRLSQVLNNLIANAIKFTSIGQISLDIMQVVQTESEIELLFMVIDTGIGIDPINQDKLFKNFSQIDNSITRKYGGTGLGLSICKRYVEAMNGTITVDSEKDKGSTFSFTVRLGIPKVSEGSNQEVSDMVPASFTEHSMKIEGSKDTDLSELDYVSRRLQDIATQKKEGMINGGRNDLIDRKDMMEKLTICIEMENWEKSEQLACKLKALFPLNNNHFSKDILRLLLTIRKEEHDNSLSIINQIKLAADEEGLL